MKVLQACVDQHQVIAGDSGAPKLAYVTSLTTPDRVSFCKMVAMVRIPHSCMWVVLDTLIERYHPTAQEIDAVVI